MGRASSNNSYSGSSGRGSSSGIRAAPRCSYCGNTGHNIRTCPEKQRVESAARHSSNSFSSRPSSEAKSKPKCSYCRISGHNIRTCPVKAKDESRASTSSSSRPSGSSSSSRSKQKCSHCRQPGHNIRTCPLKKREEAKASKPSAKARSGRGPGLGAHHYVPSRFRSGPAESYLREDISALLGDVAGVFADEGGASGGYGRERKNKLAEEMFRLQCRIEELENAYRSKAAECNEYKTKLEAVMLGSEGGLDRYDILQKLGEGAFGAALKVRHRIDQKTYVLKKQETKSANLLKLATEEVKMLSGLFHVNVARYHDSFTTKEGGKTYLYIAMEFADQGTLGESIKRGRLTDVRMKQKIVWDLACGLDYIHTLKPKPIIHRDLKPANIVITGTGPEMIAKLIDFGVATENEYSNSRAGTTVYMSKEKMRKQIYGTPDDLWSFGLVVADVATGVISFDVSKKFDTVCIALNSAAIRERITDSNKADRVLGEVAKNLLIRDAPRSRWKASQVKQFIGSIDDEKERKDTSGKEEKWTSSHECDSGLGWDPSLDNEGASNTASTLL